MHVLSPHNTIIPDKMVRNLLIISMGSSYAGQVFLVFPVSLQAFAYMDEVREVVHGLLKLSLQPLPHHFIEDDRRGGCNVQRVDCFRHGNANAKVDIGHNVRWQSGAFLS
jgi:hypothetical protein